MKKAMLITSEQGIGIHLAQIAHRFSIQSNRYIVSERKAGPANFADAYDYFADRNHYVYDERANQRIDYLIWSTGVFLHKPFADHTDFELDAMIDLHYRLPLKIIRTLHRHQCAPYHFIMIASCSSWRLRQHEAVYCGLCAAKAAFARNFANDLTQTLPGSKVTLMNPGGSKPNFFYEKDQIITDNYLNQNDLAQFIWQTVTTQHKPFLEVQYLRDKSSIPKHEPIISYQTSCPETL